MLKKTKEKKTGFLPNISVISKWKGEKQTIFYKIVLSFLSALQ